MAEARAVFALVPVKDPAQGKSRLSPLLTAEERQARIRHDASTRVGETLS